MANWDIEVSIDDIEFNTPAEEEKRKEKKSTTSRKRNVKKIKDAKLEPKPWFDKNGISNVISSNSSEVIAAITKFQDTVLPKNSDIAKFCNVSTLNMICKILSYFNDEGLSAQTITQFLTKNGKEIEDIVCKLLIRLYEFNSQNIQYIIGNVNCSKYETLLKKHATDEVKHYYDNNNQLGKDGKPLDPRQIEKETFIVALIVFNVSKLNAELQMMRDVNNGAVMEYVRDYLKIFSTNVKPGGKLTKKAIKDMVAKMGSKQLKLLGNRGYKQFIELSNKDIAQATEAFIQYYQSIVEKRASEYVKPITQGPKPIVKRSMNI